MHKKIIFDESPIDRIKRNLKCSETEIQRESSAQYRGRFNSIKIPLQMSTIRDYRESIKSVTEANTSRSLIVLITYPIKRYK